MRLSMSSSGKPSAATSWTICETATGGNMATTGVTWEATIRINATGNQERVRVQATREIDAKYLIQMLYKDATIIAGPVRVDLMRAI
jgi:hypothetical protein